MNKEAQVIPFKPAHLDLIEVREADQIHIGAEQMQYVAEAGMSGTVFYDGRVLGIIGWYEHWDGVYEIFMIPSIYVRKYAKTLIPIIKQYLDSLFTVHGAHRLQSTAWATDEMDRWMEYIGFRCEGTLAQYTKNKVDYRIWARVKEEC